METVIIGDLHGNNSWKRLVEKHPESNFIFIGDYFDSRSIPVKIQICNFIEILEFKNSHDHEVILLWGNHDVHYLSQMDNRCASGFQKGNAYIQLNILLQANMHLLKMAHRIDDIIFTHAGVSNTWLKNRGWDNEPIEEFVNDVWRYKPLSFEFDSSFKNVDSGDEVHQSPIWIRPNSLQWDNEDTLTDKYIQVVGHTTRHEIDMDNGRYYFIDTLGPSGEYLIYNDKKFSVNKM
jgi:hypothetical protein